MTETPSSQRSGGARGRTSRDRHGRGLRTPLLPIGVPAARSRSEQFDQVVLETVADLQERWSEALSTVDFAVDDVPPISADPDPPGQHIVADNGVPLARFVPPGIDPRGRQTKARVIVYRRPIEMRASELGELTELVEEVLSEQVAAIIDDPETPSSAKQ